MEQTLFFRSHASDKRIGQPFVNFVMDLAEPYGSTWQFVVCVFTLDDCRHVDTGESILKHGFAMGDKNGELTADFDHMFRAVTYASCGDEGEAVEGTGNRQYAVYYVLEGGSISCNDNH